MGRRPIRARKTKATSIWTCKRVRKCVALAIGAMALSGCEGFTLGTPSVPVQKAAMLGGAVSLAGPDGYCIDVADSRLLRGFAIMAPCATLGLEGAGLPRALGVITVQAGRNGTNAVAGTEPALAGLLSSQAGAALLSRTGSADTIDVLSTSSGDNKVTVYFEDKDGTPIAGTQDREWRGFIDLDGRLVTISVRGLESAPLGSRAGAALLDTAISALFAENES